MELLIRFVLLFLATGFESTHAAIKDFKVTWYDGREHVLQYNRSASGDCIFTRNPDILKCMRDHRYKTVADVWRYDPEAIQYVSVRCQRQEYFANHRHVCMCKSGDRAANPTSSRQHDEYHFCHVTKLQANTFMDLENLEALDLSDNSITTVESGTLKGANSLKFLDLGRNPLKSLPDSLLCDVPNLEVLSLENTMIKGFPAQIFDCGKTFSNLTYIDLSDGEIATIARDSLKNLNNIISLNLSCNALSTIHPRTFDNAKKLEYLDLSRNDFVTFPKGICEPTDYLHHVRLDENHFDILNVTNFQECSHVTYLDISFNNIRKIIGNINKTLSVIHLNLSHNFIQDLSDQFLGNLKKLAVLDIAKNEIKSISSNAFLELPSLRHLNITGNSISNSIDLQQVFIPLENLTHLYLAGNRLQTLAPEFFQPLAYLKFLDLSRNELRTLDSQAFKGLVSLTNLSLSWNRISVLPPDVFQNLPILKHIDLSYNLLSVFDDFALPSTLLSLDIGHNTLQTFPNSASHTAIITFDLNHNSIARLARDRMDHLEELKYLDLTYNEISVIDDNAFEGLRNLEYLNVSHNQLVVNLSLDIFKGSSNINTLDLSYNNINSVDFMFSHNTLDNLKSLVLSNNPLYTITDLMNKPANSQSPGLEDIILSNCSIRNVTSTACKGLKNLGVIDLSDNLIHEFDPLETKVGTQFNLAGNPLVCSCAMAWLSNRYVNVDGNKISTFDYKVEKCSVFPKLIKVDLRLVEKEDFLCRTEVGCDINCACFKHIQNGPVVTVLCTDGLNTPPTKIPGTTNILHLDGNKFTKLNSDLSNGKSMLTTGLYLNMSGIQQIDTSVFRNFKFLEILDLSNNRLTDILPFTFKNQTNLESLNISHNFLTSLYKDSFYGIDRLAYLDLRYNEFQTVDSIFISELSRFGNAFWVFLGHNPYSCTCVNADFRRWVDSYSNQIHDKWSIICQENGREMKSVPQQAFVCQSDNEGDSKSGNSTVILAAVIATVVALVVIAAMLYYKRDLLAVIYTKLHLGCLRPASDKTKTNDAFVVYDTNASKCCEWVRLMFMKKLERKRNYKFIFPDRVRLLQSVADMESHQMYDCKCAVFIVNSSFMNNNWSAECFRKACRYSQENKKFRVILVIFGDIDPSALPPEMNQLLRKGDYITARSRSAWDRLIYELPDPQDSRGHPQDNLSESDVILYKAPAYQTLDDGDISITT